MIDAQGIERKLFIRKNPSDVEIINIEDNGYNIAEFIDAYEGDVALEIAETVFSDAEELAGLKLKDIMDLVSEYEDGQKVEICCNLHDPQMQYFDFDNVNLIIDGNDIAIDSNKDTYARGIVPIVARISHVGKTGAYLF